MPGYELFGKEERQAVIDLFDANGGVLFAHGFDGLRKGVYKVREFEKAIAARVGVPHAQAVSSGSAALLVALRSLGIEPGDEVITQSFTFVATAEAIIESGATPVITEIDKSLNMDPADFERRITPRTKAVIPVHMAGAPANMKAILEIAKRKNVLVLEDAAQGFGGSYGGKPLGTLGDAGIYSFDFAKNITTGEGGAIVTNSEKVFKAARAYHDHGHEYNPNFPRGKDTRTQVGFNYRMTEIQAAIGLAQLKKLEHIVQRQRENKKMIKESLADLKLEFRHLNDAEGDIGDTLIFFLESEGHAAAFAKQLAQKSVGTKNLPDAIDWHFAGTWDHLFKKFAHLQNPKDLWPASTQLLRRSIALPVNVNMAKADIEKVIQAVREILK